MTPIGGRSRNAIIIGTVIINPGNVTPLIVIGLKFIVPSVVFIGKDVVVGFQIV
jgi:hypothetical protein